MLAAHLIYLSRSITTAISIQGRSQKKCLEVLCLEDF